MTLYFELRIRSPDPVVAFFLMDYHAVGRFAAIGCFMFEIALIVAPKQYLIENSGNPLVR